MDEAAEGVKLLMKKLRPLMGWCTGVLTVTNAPLRDKLMECT